MPKFQEKRWPEQLDNQTAPLQRACVRPCGRLTVYPDATRFRAETMSSQDPYSGAPQHPVQQPKSNNKPVLIIVLVVVGLLAVPCIGILAAIAIPAFLRYSKQSKAAEAEMVLARMVTEVETNHLEACAFPPELERHADIAACAGGEKCLSSGEIEPFWTAIPQLQQPTYFVYSASVEGDAMVLRAEADFRIGEPYHTVTRTVSVVDDCEVQTGPALTTNEFE